MTRSAALQHTGPDQASLPALRSVLRPPIGSPLSERAGHPPCALIQGAGQSRKDARRADPAPGCEMFERACARPPPRQTSLASTGLVADGRQYVAMFAGSSATDCLPE